MLLGIVRPTAGTVRVLGLDPARDPLTVRQRVRYVPENHAIYPWMKVAQVFRFVARLYRHWNWDDCDRLTARLGVPAAQQVKTLSRGQLAKVALVVALAHDPELLILDEPTSGLDPAVRREFLDVLSEVARGRRCTILFSTHILGDVERVADRVVILDGGRVLANDALGALRSRYVKASLLFRTPPRADEPVPLAVRVERVMREWVAIFPAMPEARIREIAAAVGADDCMVQPATLDDVYLELVPRRAHEPAASADAGNGGNGA